MKGNHKQQGIAMLILVFMIALALTSYFLSGMSGESLKRNREAKTAHALAEAKSALLGWSVSHPEYPGIMPFPDRNADGNYDGNSDCVTTAVLNYSHLIGRLPHFSQTTPCIGTLQHGLTGSFIDGDGEGLWYAISRNLIKTSAIGPVINPSIINNPAFPWLVVRDNNGQVISNRVAAVVIASGRAVGGQSRSGAANISQYLDTVTIGGVTYNNFDYNSPDEDFVVSQNVLAMNDRLVFITVEELVYALEKRVLQEARSALTTFSNANNYYPFAAGLGVVSNQNQCMQGNLRGLLPTNNPTDYLCNCTALDKTCRCNFSAVSSTTFTRDDGGFAADGSGVNSPIGACSVSATDIKTCDCNGAGACKSVTGSTDFQCDACGDCVASVDGVNRFSTTGIFANHTGSCTEVANQVECINTTNGNFILEACNNSQSLGAMPGWFTSNQWERFIVYAVSSDCVAPNACTNGSPPKITVGLSQDVNALVASSLANPNNSCSLSSYLSSNESNNIVVSNGLQDSLYQATQPKTPLNSDQLVKIP